MMEAMQKALVVPHMTFCDEVNADRLGQLRADLKAASERRGVRLSYLPLIVKVNVPKVIVSCPGVRRSGWFGGKIVHLMLPQSAGCANVFQESGT